MVYLRLVLIYLAGDKQFKESWDVVNRARMYVLLNYSVAAYI